MSNKEIVIDLIERLPQNATLLEIAKEIEFVAGVREGFAQLDRGEGVPLEEVEKQLPSWITR
jgi:predicted transcriptional regulator